MHAEDHDYGGSETPTLTQPNDSKPFGTRYLTDESLVFEQNAWDHVPPPDDQEERIQAALDRQRKSPVPADKKEKYNARPSLYWDIFYRNNQNNFFKDRKWLQREFPQLEAVTDANAGPKTVFEVGCGAGNVVFPLLASNKNPDLRITACDFSKHAVRVVKSNPLYESPPLGTVHASVWDLSSQTLPEGLEPESVDIAVMVFVLSALHPSQWAQAIANIYTLLKPGGIVVLRDYGRHDLTQLRFKEGRLLDENFYIRGDGTRVYFFEPTELGKLFTGSDIDFKEDGPRLRMLKILKPDDTSTALSTPNKEPGASTEMPPMDALSIVDLPSPAKVETILVTEDEIQNDVAGADVATGETFDTEEGFDGMSFEDMVTPSRDRPTGPSKKAPPEELPILKPSPHPSELAPHPLFTITQLGIDRRLLINRKKQLKMYRVWLQGEFRKTGGGSDGEAL